MKTRIIVCPLIRNSQNQYLICKMPATRGAYPNQWGLPGGGMEKGENITEALLREVKEELGEKVTFSEIVPWTFRDDTRTKLYPDGTSQKVYMVYLIFDCLIENSKIELSDEFEKYEWVDTKSLINYDLNDATKITFQQKGFLK